MTDRVDIPPGFDSERSDSMTKRYPTRMHEVLGVEPEERFTFSEYGDRKFWLSGSGLLYGAYDDGKGFVGGPTTQGTLVRFINHPERITRRPRLTEEQVAQLKALVTLGYGWIVKDLEGLPYACASKPKKERDDWRDGGAFTNLYPFMPTNCLMDLPDWSDPEPLDIVQTLRQNGEEVEG